MSYFGENIYQYRDYLMLNEAFVGKTPILEEIEKKLGELRPKLKYHGANNTMKEVLELNRLFEKQFGMDLFALDIYPSDYPNGYTYPIAINFDVAEEVILHNMIVADRNNGYRFKPHNNFCVIVAIATKLIMDQNYTDEEIVACFLHEIGHNFADCIYDKIEFDNNSMMIAYKKSVILTSILLACTIIGIPLAIKNLNSLKKFNNARKYRIEKNKRSKIGKGKFGAFIKAVKASVNDKLDMVSQILYRLSGSYKLAKGMRYASIDGAEDYYKKSIDRQNEVFADKFAAVYGYGPAHASLLLKMDKYKTSAEIAVSKLGKFGEKINEEYDNLWREINKFDVHPQNIQRVLEKIKLLENELKKEDIEPKVKEVIEKQLQQLRDILDDATTVTKEMSKSEKAQTLYNQYIRNECPDAIEDDLEEAIEKALDDALDNKK